MGYAKRIILRIRANVFIILESLQLTTKPRTGQVILFFKFKNMREITSIISLILTVLCQLFAMYLYRADRKTDALYWLGLAILFKFTI